MKSCKWYVDDPAWNSRRLTEEQESDTVLAMYEPVQGYHGQLHIFRGPIHSLSMAGEAELPPFGIIGEGLRIAGNCPMQVAVVRCPRSKLDFPGLIIEVSLLELAKLRLQGPKLLPVY